MEKIRIVASREYIKNITRPMFWMVTLAFPTLMIVIGVVTGYSSKSLEEKTKAGLGAETKIGVVVRNPMLTDVEVTEEVEVVNPEADAQVLVTSGKYEAVFVYEDNLQKDGVKVFAQDPGLVNRGQYGQSAISLLRNQVMAKLNDSERSIVNNQIKVDAKFFNEDGMLVEDRLESFIAPIVSIIIYFMLTFLGSQFLLMSVSEEKENRMMEIVLSTLSARQLIWGKLIGLVGLALTQMLILVGSGVMVGLVAINYADFPINFSAVNLDPIMMGLGLFYAICGFLLMASLMVGAGAAMPTYREAQSFASIFILASIFPIYFSSLILAEPQGLIARVASYFPLTAPLVLLVRNALGALPAWEMVLGTTLLVGYVGGGFYLAFKLFEIGSLEYANKINFQNLWKNRAK